MLRSRDLATTDLAIHLSFGPRANCVRQTLKERDEMKPRPKKRRQWSMKLQDDRRSRHRLALGGRRTGGEGQATRGFGPLGPDD